MGGADVSFPVCATRRIACTNRPHSPQYVGQAPRSSWLMVSRGRRPRSAGTDRVGTHDTPIVAWPFRPCARSRAGRPSKTVFSFSEGGPRQAYSSAVAGRMRGRFASFTSRLAAKTFTLLAGTADRRYGEVSGGQRGGGRGVPGHALGHAGGAGSKMRPLCRGPRRRVIQLDAIAETA